MSTSWHFPFFVVASFVVFVWLIRFVTRQRKTPPSLSSILLVSLVVVLGGMVFARFGASAGWPWWIYYTVPALVTLLVPPLVFRLTLVETVQYLTMAFLSSPFIHVFFSLFLDWHEYLPFIWVPSLQSLLGVGSNGT